MLVTILGTYLSSVAALTYNILRGADRIRKRILELREEGVAEGVISEEKLISGLSKIY